MRSESPLSDGSGEFVPANGVRSGDELWALDTREFHEVLSAIDGPGGVGTLAMLKGHGVEWLKGDVIRRVDCVK